MLMKRLRFAFITTVQYSQPVHGHQLALRCVPLNDAGQLLETYTVKIMPGRLPAPQKDGFGNTVFWCSIGSEHNVLRYGSRGIARVEEPGQPAPPPNPCLGFAGLRTKPGRILMQVSSAMARGKTLAALDALCHAVHSLLRYQPGATGIYTTAEEALAGGRGVCQDYAHVFIALARLAGWHARYCMGLTVGEGATHAWAEIYYEGAWYGFDPTRDCRTDASYLRFATGRDAADCPVEQGTFYGLADQTQTVFMRVKEI